MLFDRTPVAFPRLFSPPRPGVLSPFTCRHPKHLRCACHGEPAATAATTTAGKHQESAVPRTTHTEALRRIKRYYLDLLSEIIDTIRDFPEAAAAVGEKLRTGAALEPDHPDFAYE